MVTRRKGDTMKIVININTGNAAFEDNPHEAREIIGQVQDHMGIGPTEGPLFDSNGNKVGNFKVTGK
jgi:hypothetical protein